MKKQISFIIILILAIFAGCGKSERPSDKFSGTYPVKDSWSSTKTLIGSGNLAYDLIIVPDGDDGVVLMNVNKTLNGVKAKVKDNQFTIEKQIAKSIAGKSYTVMGQTGMLTENKLNLYFSYSDEDYGDAIGEVRCDISGTKEKKQE
jgi:hypothetical protein